MLFRARRFGGAVAVALAASTLEPARAQPPYAEAIVVRELEVFFDDSVLPPLESLGRRADDDFLVLLDGRPLAPTASPPAPSADDGRLREVVLWFDPELAAPAALAAAARTLATPPPTLRRAERIRIALAAPGERPRELEISSPERLAEELARQARAWEAAPAAPPTLDARLRALDRLAARLALESGGGQRALVVAGDAWSVDAASLNDLAALERGERPSNPRLVRLEETARLVAAAGWTLFPFSARPAPASSAGMNATPEEISVAGDSETHSFAWFTFPARDGTPPARIAVQLELATDLGLRPWAHLARASAGTLAGDRFSLERALARAAQRRRLRVGAPDRPPGPLLPLEVRWTGGDGRALPASHWIASGLAPESAAVRLRALAAGDLSRDDSVPLAFRAAANAILACLLTPARPASSSAEEKVWLRAAARIERAGGAAEIVHGAAVEAIAAGIERCAPVPHPALSAGAPPPLVLVEELDGGVWGAETLVVP